MKIEGGYRKPVWKDLVIVQFVMLPYSLFQYGLKYHRRYISKQVHTSGKSNMHRLTLFEAYIPCSNSMGVFKQCLEFNLVILFTIFVQPLPLEDKLEMARERVGLASWEELDTAEQDKLIEKQIWQVEVYNAWVEEKVAEETKRLNKLNRSGKLGPANSSGKAFKKRGANAGQDDDNEDDDY